MRRSALQVHIFYIYSCNNGNKGDGSKNQQHINNRRRRRRRKKTIVKLFVHHLRSVIRKQWCAVHWSTHTQRTIETPTEHAKRQWQWQWQWMWSGAKITLIMKKKKILKRRSCVYGIRTERWVDANFIAMTEYIILQMSEWRERIKMLEQISNNKKFESV